MAVTFTIIAVLAAILTTTATLNCWQNEPTESDKLAVASFLAMFAISSASALLSAVWVV